ncbi:hypothetical protein ABNC92_10560 [Paenibacillus larvae]|uniref:Uncharacterized protein n=4 Tax=Halcyonevirus TaxID=2843388 RepID=A0A345ASF9_9CAUD|nr:hypothetical protein [Paenibacillus larvae]YP_009210522.1 hypothetical protein TRIPP_2 [Paenibacillus phage Tripp]YP_010082169.1 hypothetical protein KMD17_gp02 [Paenibacillus phage C7Cdelta]AXF39929.1 hypothetical protein ASH_2 [Paenibacillus phage Ash]AXF40216.1 hypothetical protein LEY_2 [Paenibacillus phage Ley]ALH46375.1 hypothetical protein TRIPP_2 [Paenibacillus phage Tripp]AXF39763.1 hypothetical protein C7CDELTA_2 [Paenibacillus phage C7Cdelta]ETK27971.1 hypothetical protein ERIC
MSKLEVAASVLIGIFIIAFAAVLIFAIRTAGLSPADTALLITVYALTILSAIRGLRWLR